MIKEIHFENFKVLKSATLPLGRFTLIVGANGSGKSTALSAFQILLGPINYSIEDLRTAGSCDDVSIQIDWTGPLKTETAVCWKSDTHPEASYGSENGDRNRGHFKHIISDPDFQKYWEWLTNSCVYSLNPQQIAGNVGLRPKMTLGPDGRGLAGVLDSVRDENPKRFDELNGQLRSWLPEYDQILFYVPADGNRAFQLRTIDGHNIPAADLSDGTLLALAILTIAYLPDPPKLVAFEEPDHGLHPRLLGQVQEALYRLAYPDRFGETREPVQVIATTHSPYFLDLFKDSPEEIVIAEKTNGGATFQRLSKHPHIDEILGDAPLGEVWFSGVLGGVPAES